MNVLGSNWSLPTMDDQSSIKNESEFALYEQPVLRDVRISVLWLLAVMGLFGNFLVFLWLWTYRRRMSRILYLFLNLAISDTLVISCATSPQLAWEYADRGWRWGDPLCRTLKFMQTFTICVSNYLIVAIAVDRHRAIRRPLSPTWQVNLLGGGSWVAAAVINSPTFVLFQETEYRGQTVCRNVLYDAPVVTLRIYLTVVILLVFIIPLLAITVCYMQIFRKIAEKAKDSSLSAAIPKGCTKRKPTTSMQLNANKTSSLPKAKIKTLRLTLVIITSFLACSAPYCMVEMWRVYGDYMALDATTYSIAAALAVSNSSTNPFVFLAFHFNSSLPSRKRPTVDCRVQSPVPPATRACCCCCTSGARDVGGWCDVASSDWTVDDIPAAPTIGHHEQIVNLHNFGDCSNSGAKPTRHLKTDF